ncbi:hypothetical protein TEQG_08707 [Trichophyton equinum CBS 127.97]|uniref:Uncharacterized protein n=1 Tax=Trichophyton equinum (strain ATCC MYA-4606 / CBS 127.97) TaxID=559882 RepID=F2PVB8_TRIEC|nr:hypothetical protein TEQG_08707 [Trichophyton equinum CBS 127.97]
MSYSSPRWRSGNHPTGEQGMVKDGDGIAHCVD